MNVGTIIDVVLGVIILIAIIVGAKKGFAKQLTSLVAGVGTIIGAMLLCTIVTNYLLTLPLVEGWLPSVQGWFAKLPGATTPVASVEELTAALNTGWLRILSSQASSLFATMQALGCTSFDGYLGHMALRYILEIASFILLYIVLLYIVKGIGALLNRINRIGFFKVLDKLLGILMSLAMTYLIVVVVILTGTEMLLTKYLPQYQDPVLFYIAQSYLLTVAHNTNVLGSLLADMLGIVLPELAVILPDPVPVDPEVVTESLLRIGNLTKI